jgi:hypothetical protein
MLSSAAQALPDDYLAAVAADVREFSTGSFVAPRNSGWIGGGGSQAADDGTASLAAFDAFFKKRFPGTYILFARLAAHDKEAVWKDYVKTGDLERLRANILAVRSAPASDSSRSAIMSLPSD